MCGRYVSTSSLSELADEYDVDEVRGDDLGARYNVAPTQPIYAVATRRPRRPEKETAEGGKGPARLLGTFRWGLIPSWAKEASIGSKLINARAEGIATKPAFRSALLRRRCIILADAFYEWQVQAPGPDGKKKGRLPYVVRRQDRRPLSFAGLWEVWRDPSNAEAAPLRTATIITTSANRSLEAIHPRMPVVLPTEAVERWLDPALDDVADLQPLLVPAPEEWWESYAVGSRVNAVANEGPDLVEPLPPRPGSGS